MLRVSERDLRYNDEEGIYYYGDRPFTGVAFNTYPNGSPMSETPYEDGLFHGTSRGWWESGKPETEASYAFGGAHGTSRKWRERRMRLRAHRGDGKSLALIKATARLSIGSNVPSGRQ